MEHAIPISRLYDDVLTLFALSGTGYTPTHIVNYGGAFGEQFVWATHDVPNDPKYEYRDTFFRGSIENIGCDGLRNTIYSNL